MSANRQRELTETRSLGTSRTTLFLVAMAGVCATSFAMSLGGSQNSARTDKPILLERTIDDYRAMSVLREERLRSFRIVFVEEDDGGSATWADRSEFLIERQGDLWRSVSSFIPGPHDAPTTASTELHAVWTDAELVLGDPAQASAPQVLDERGFAVWNEWVPSAGVTYGMLQLPNAPSVAASMSPPCDPHGESGLATDPLAAFLRFGDFTILEPDAVMGPTGLAQVVHLVDTDGGNRATMWLDVTTGLVVRFALGGFEWRVEEIAWYGDVPIPSVIRRGSLDAWALVDRGEQSESRLGTPAIALPAGSLMVTGRMDLRLSHVPPDTSDASGGPAGKAIRSPLDILR